MTNNTKADDICDKLIKDALGEPKVVQMNDRLKEIKKLYDRNRYTELAEVHYDNIWWLIEQADLRQSWEDAMMKWSQDAEHYRKLYEQRSKRIAELDAQLKGCLKGQEFSRTITGRPYK